MPTTQLPDVANTSLATEQIAINWVGMDEIAIPILLEEPAGMTHSHAGASIAVDLPGGEHAARGIHMSRLYFLLNELAQQTLSGPNIQNTLEQVLASHLSLGSSAARLELQFDFLMKRPALISHSPAGWRRYPIKLCAELIRGNKLAINLQLDILYSSTCPCSAALVRENLAKEFLQHFSNEQALSASLAADWLKQNGTLATPHSQRSIAQLSVPIQQHANSLGLVKLIEQIETAVATPVQTSVKRIDEQAFAQLNGQNLMFVEDISRRLATKLKPAYPNIAIQVRHLESLHAHNAFAQVLPETPSSQLRPQFNQ